MIRYVSNLAWIWIPVILVTTAGHAFASGMTHTGKVDLSDMVLIPAGDFIMGSDLVEKSNKSGEFGNVKPWYLDEHPKHKETLPAYYLEEHEVTNEQYRKYIEQTGTKFPDYWLTTGYVFSMQLDKLKTVNEDKLRKLATNIFHIDKDTRKMNKDELLKDIANALKNMDKLAVAEVSWEQASNYCLWNGLRLPTEAEWEKAARGNSGSIFPWGNTWKTNMSNTGSEQWETHIAPVESYPTDKSPFGIYDMAGNVSEWVEDWYKAYKGSDYKSKNFGKKYKVVRGAGWSGGEGHYALQLFQRGAYRGDLPPEGTYDDVGFRCAADETSVFTAPKINEN